MARRRGKDHGKACGVGAPSDEARTHTTRELPEKRSSKRRCYEVLGWGRPAHLM